MGDSWQQGRSVSAQISVKGNKALGFGKKNKSGTKKGGTAMGEVIWVTGGKGEETGFNQKNVYRAEKRGGTG